jgi:uncharacterized membrane protein YgdD (TMEM256/DUF423 family)
MEIIIHVMMAYGAVRVHKARVSIQEVGPWVASQCCPYQLVHLLILLSKWVGVLAPWKQALRKNTKTLLIFFFI